MTEQWPTFLRRILPSILGSRGRKIMDLCVGPIQRKGSWLRRDRYRIDGGNLFGDCNGQSRFD